VLGLLGLAFAATLSACGGSNVDAHRLTVLSQDPVATAQAPDTTPWIPAVATADAIRGNGEAGSGNGIGFGGTSPTLALVTRHLNGSPSAAVRFYAETAIRAGWRLFHIDCHRYGDSFAAAKQFPGWVGSVVVGTGRFKGAPAVTITLETDYHDGAATRLSVVPAERPLTVHDLASTCVGGSL
jgi:hypothetical protein